MDTVIIWGCIALFFGIVLAGALTPMAQAFDDYVPPSDAPAQAADSTAGRSASGRERGPQDEEGAK